MAAEEKSIGRMVVTLGLKNELIPVIEGIGQRLDAANQALQECKAELHAIAQAVLDNLSHLAEFKSIGEEEPPTTPEDP